MKHVVNAVPTYTGPSLLEVDYDSFAVNISPYVYEVEVFKRIVTRDRGGNDSTDKKGRYKKHAKRELAYIHLMYSHKSPYKKNTANETDRHNQIKKDLELPSNWKVDEELQGAIDKYIEMVTDHLVQLYDSAMNGMSKLKNYLDEADFHKVDDKGKPLYDIKQYRETIKDINTISQQLDDLESKIQERQAEESNNYGQVADTDFN